MLDISIIGAGRMGGALALALDAAGCRVDQLIYRSSAPTLAFLNNQPEILPVTETKEIVSSVVFITTQDSEIVAAAETLKPMLSSGSVVFIVSGAYSSESIAFLRDVGCHVGSIHPLVSVSDPELGSQRFKNAYFCIEGDPNALEIALQVVDLLKGNSFSIPTDKKALYHAAAVMSSGHFVALIDCAISLLEKCGLDRPQGKAVLLPLIGSTLDNLRELAPENALTGTFARGDVTTFRSHMAALKRDADAELTEIYRTLGNRSIEIARRRGERAELDQLADAVNGNS